jgi:predicted metal-dependent phosphoesterase TrpH
MGVYHLDLHVHSRFSADSMALPEDIIAQARARGLHGFAITDHNTSECVDYLRSTGLMSGDGTPVDGFLIIPGQEITTSEGHLLALGISLPPLKGITPAEAVTLIHEKGGLAIPPHPYDQFRAGIDEEVLDTLPIDAVEVFNAATTFKRFNRHAFAYAQRRGLPMTAASDAHQASVVGTAYTIVETDDFTVNGILEGIRRGASLHQRYLTARETFKKTWGNITRLRRRRRPVVKPPAVSEPVTPTTPTQP